MFYQVGLPLLGIMSTGEVAVNYLNATNYMVGGHLLWMALYLDLPSVSWRFDHGNCGGALWTPQQGGVEDHHDGGDVAGEADARLHVHHHVPLHVDLQHRHHGHDASNRFIGIVGDQQDDCVDCSGRSGNGNQRGGAGDNDGSSSR